MAPSEKANTQPRLPVVAQAVAPAPNRISDSAKPAATSFKYKFENARFYIPLIEIELDPDTRGQLRFKRGESDDVIERKLKVLPKTMARLVQLIERLSFLSSNEEFQSKKDFSHLGWMTISARQGPQERTVRFNYTTNPEMSELVEIFRAIATQSIDLFDLELALQHQPLDVPRLLESLEDDLRLGRIAEPEQLLILLVEMSNDDTLPLIARNHTYRIITDIKKGKYKGPVKREK